MHIISHLDTGAFESLCALTSGPRSFDISEQTREKVSSAFGLSNDGLSHLLSAISFLYRQLRPSPDQTQDDLRQQVDEVIDDIKLTGDVDRDILSQRLAKLLTFRPTHHTYMKVARLEEGFLARVLNVASYVDLRPSFSEDRTSIEGVVPLVQLLISTASPRNFEAHCVFQLDLEGLEKLRAAIRDIDAKIAAIKLPGEIGIPLLILDDNGQA